MEELDVANSVSAATVTSTDCAARGYLQREVQPDLLRISERDVGVGFFLKTGQFRR